MTPGLYELFDIKIKVENQTKVENQNERVEMQQNTNLNIDDVTEGDDVTECPGSSSSDTEAYRLIRRSDNEPLGFLERKRSLRKTYPCNIQRLFKL